MTADMKVSEVADVLGLHPETVRGLPQRLPRVNR